MSGKLKSIDWQVSDKQKSLTRLHDAQLAVENRKTGS